MIKDVIVHLDGSSTDEERLQHAEIFASASQAHLTGLLTNPLPDFSTLVPMDGGAAAAEILSGLEEDALRQGDLMQQRLAERFSRLAVPNEIRRLNGTPGQLPGLAASEARWSDLFIAGQPYQGNGASQWDALFEAVLFEGGRGVLVVPPGRPPADAIRRVVVCWRDTRESARAVAEALPIIEKSARTIILLVDPEDTSGRDGSASSSDIAKHLDRHGARIEVSIADSNGRNVSDVILEQATRASADLIVMGGYGHSRAREWMIGGATRDMLNSSSFPILMAH
jgi:nucleotide-binding universal stress UspA family protein